MLTFYMTPGSCSTGIHILLEEVDALFSVELVNLIAGDQNSDAYRALNPKGSIPMLRLPNGAILTEFEAIACWIAWEYPRAALMPEDRLAAARAIELTSYCVGSLHGQGFARYFTPERFAVGEQDVDAIRQQGERRVAEAFAVIERSIPSDGWLCGGFSIADAALFYPVFWADRSGLPIPSAIASHYARMLERRAVRQVLMEEGYRL
jgi:glutathione S-transferase